MKLLADEGVDKPIVTALREAGFDITYVLEINSGAADDVVLAQKYLKDRIHKPTCQQNSLSRYTGGALAGRMRGAIMPSLIFFVTFFHQGKKVKEQDNSVSNTIGSCLSLPINLT